MPTLKNIEPINSAVECLRACAQDYATHCDKTLASACRKAARDLKRLQDTYGVKKSS